VTRAEIKSRVRTGSLLPVHRGVYRVGHRAPSVEARYLAAVLACGEGALLSGRAAAHLLGLLKGSAPPPEVTTRTERRVPGVRTRRSRRLDLADATTWRQIPVTSVARTLVDVAADLPLDALARACHEAGVKHRTTPRQVEAVLAQRPNTPGATKLHHILRGDVRVTLSKLEKRFVQLLRHSTAAPGRARAPTNEPPRRRPPRGLPLARPKAHHRARQLPIPPLPPRLGAGPPPRARGPRPRRRVPPLHLRRCLRVPGADAHGAARSAASGPASAGSGSSASDHSLTVAVRPRTSNSPTSTRSSTGCLR
jgi:hypothetical protein